MSGDTACLVCSPLCDLDNAPTDVCRSCILFFIRARPWADRLNCLDGNDACVVSPSTQPGLERWKCRRCRYLKCLQYITPRNSASTSRGSSAEIYSEDAPALQQLDVKRTFCIPAATEPGHPSSTVYIGRVLLHQSDISLLRKLHRNYRDLCMTRLTNETATLSVPTRCASKARSHATISSINVIHKIAAAALFKFADDLIEEYSSISAEEKWSLIRASLLCLLIFEDCYHAEQKLPDMPNILFLSFLGYWANEELDACFVDVENKEWIQEAIIILRKDLASIVRLRARLRAAAIDETEYVALVGLIFWGNRATDAHSPRVAVMAERARSSLFRELHHYYREGRGIDDYAIRIGGLMQLLDAFQECELEIAKNMEIFRLLDIVAEDSFTYQFCAKQRMLR